jgi:hypothetical protein
MLCKDVQVCYILSNHRFHLQYRIRLSIYPHISIKHYMYILSRLPIASFLEISREDRENQFRMEHFNSVSCRRTGVGINQTNFGLMAERQSKYTPFDMSSHCN